MKSDNFSVIIPVYNESGNILQLIQELQGVIEKNKYQAEIILVDDGSRDSTVEKLQVHLDANKINSTITIITLNKNYGQSLAFMAGIDHATKDVIFTMDGDLQNDPNDIPRFLTKLDEGHDVISGWRKNRKDPQILKVIPSKVANILINKILGTALNDYGCSMKVYKRKVLKDVCIYGELHRFLPAMAHFTGAKIGEIEVNHRPRVNGTSNYGIDKSFRVMLDLLSVFFIHKFQTKPIHFLGLPGLVSSFLGTLICCYLTFIKFAYDEEISHRPLLSLGILLIIVGIQFLGIGLIAELVTRFHMTSSQAPKMYRIHAVKNY